MQFIGNYKSKNTLFLRDTHHPVAHRICQGVPKYEKACLVEIKQTAHKLETNADTNFPMAESRAYQCMENGGRNMPSHRLF